MTWQGFVAITIVGAAIAYLLRVTTRGWRRHARGGCHGCGMRKIISA
ncbi:MAG: hypothetical protein HY696_11640 [Deltaproteobacteria bacterium]|nr:hypothetical protein [Deltaproteobacteria bacterium]